MKDKNSILWIKAMDDELKSFESLKTWTVVDPSQYNPSNILSSKWVFKVKED